MHLKGVMKISLKNNRSYEQRCSDVQWQSFIFWKFSKYKCINKNISTEPSSHKNDNPRRFPIINAIR